MKRSFLPLLLCLLLSACGAAKTLSPSVPQQYQALHRTLAATTAANSRLSSDAARLNRDLSRQQLDAIRVQDATLRGDAISLEARAGSSAGLIRPLIGKTRDSHFRTYLRQVSASLAFQWAEADSLVHAADILWWDPWIMTRGDETTFAHLVAGARWDAWQSVQSVWVAAAIRRKYHRAFRYAPVRGRGRPALAAGAPRGSAR